MRRLIAACVASVLLYAMLFGLILDRPLSLGLPRAQVDATAARGAAITGPKLVVLAGSNGPYSHRCETMEAILQRPCVNGGVAVGIGLDYLFARWQPVLRKGDIIYLPLEEAQYRVGFAAARLGPDAAIMARHDRDTLARLPPQRWIAALFSFDLRAGIMSLLEITLLAAGFHDPRAEASGGSNAWGDHVGHTKALAAANQAVLAHAVPIHATAAQVGGLAAGRQVADFLAWAHDHGVLVVGGLPTGFADSPIPGDTLAAIRTLFKAHGAAFLEPANQCRYPRRDFFDTADHLHEEAQIAHSQMIATELVAMGLGLAQGGSTNPAVIQTAVGITAAAEFPPRR